jgi:hypothetical protein
VAPALVQRFGLCGFQTLSGSLGVSSGPPCVRGSQRLVCCAEGAAAPAAEMALTEPELLLILAGRAPAALLQRALASAAIQDRVVKLRLALRRELQATAQLSMEHVIYYALDACGVRLTPEARSQPARPPAHARADCRGHSARPKCATSTRARSLSSPRRTFRWRQSPAPTRSR